MEAVQKAMEAGDNVEEAARRAVAEAAASYVRRAFAAKPLAFEGPLKYIEGRALQADFCSVCLP